MYEVKNIILINDYADVNGGAAQVCIQSACYLKKSKYNVVLLSATSIINRDLIEAGVIVLQTNQYDFLIFLFLNF